MRTVESVDSKHKRCNRIDSGTEMAWLPTGAFGRRTENVVAHEGLIYWSPMTIAETEHRSEDERFSSEELGSGAGLTVVESLFSLEEVVAI